MDIIAIPAQYRHGDLLVERVNAIPGTAEKIPGRTLAEGKATGHSHALTGGQLYRDSDGKIYFSADTDVALVHEEHNRIEIPAGSYQVTIQREYVAPDTTREVWD